MAKSKAYKAAKQQQREDDFAETEALDSSFAALLQGGGLAGMVKAKGQKDRSTAVGNRGDAAYDKLRRELTFEPKGKVCLYKTLFFHESLDCLSQANQGLTGT